MVYWRKTLGRNLREVRKAKGYTQIQLGELLNYSEKTIAKWESAISVPSIDALLSVCKVLDTNLDRLFRSEKNIYYLGIDGGGTKTALLLTDKDGMPMNSLIVESTNPYVVGIDRAKKTLERAIYDICKGVSLSNVIMFAGIAGGGVIANKRIFHEFIN